MKRTTITWSEDTVRAVEHAARRRRKSISATVRELVEKQLEEERKITGFEALIGIIDDPSLPAGASIDDALAETWADAIARDRG